MLYSMSNVEDRSPGFSLWCDAVIIQKPGLQIGSFMHLIITYTQNVLVLQCWWVYPYCPSHRQDSHLRNHYTNNKTVSHCNAQMLPISPQLVHPVIHWQRLIPGQSHYVPVSTWNCAHIIEKLLNALDHCPQDVTVSNSSQAFRVSWQSCFPSHSSYARGRLFNALIFLKSPNRHILCHPRHQTITS